ncbi:hypothetical protein Tco_0967631 [Tanacetum coccineum]
MSYPYHFLLGRSITYLLVPIRTVGLSDCYDPAESPETPSTSYPLPLPTSSPPLQLLSSDHKTDRPEITLPPQKRLGIDLGPRYDDWERFLLRCHLDDWSRRKNYGFVDPREAIKEVAPITLEGVNARYHYETARILDQEALVSREAWGCSIETTRGRSDGVRLGYKLLKDKTQMVEFSEAVMDPQKAMINEGVTAALAARDATRNGDDSHTSGTGARRPVQVARECTYPDFLKCQPLNFKGTEGVVGLTQWFEKMESVYSISNCIVACQVKFATCTLQGNALTWWNSHVKTTTPEAAHAMPWRTLKKMMTDKLLPRGEI